MTHNVDSTRGSSISPRLESNPGGNYIDLRFSRQNSNNVQRSHSDTLSFRTLSTLSFVQNSNNVQSSDGYDSDDFIDFCFSGDQKTDHLEDLAEKLKRLKAHSGALKFEQRATTVTDNEQTTATKFFMADFKEMRSPRVSEGTLRADIEDFYAALSIGLDSLQGLLDPGFLSANFLQQSFNLLHTVDSEARLLLEKLAELRNPSSVDFCQSLIEYTSISKKILEICHALKFSTTMLKAYQSSQVEESVVALEGLVSLPKGASRSIHVVKAEEAAQCIDSVRTEMVQMQAQAKELVELGNLGSLSYFVPDLNIMICPDHFADSDLTKWSGLWGVLFAMKTTSSYISQLLLGGLAHAGQGPMIILESTKTASFNFGWASSLVALHIQVRKQFDKIQDSIRSSGSFMSQDNDRLEFMLEDTKGHLQSLLDQGKFLNIGSYIGSWQADKKKLMHNVPRLRRHLLLVRHRLSDLCEGIECLSGNMIYGQEYLAQI